MGFKMWKAAGNDPFSTKDSRVGDVKTFSDGHQRVLNETASGVKRWLRTEEGGGAMKFKRPQNSAPKATVSITEEPPSEITKKEWLGFNGFLVEDNPFIHCTTYNDMVIEWFTAAYMYDGKLDIAKQANDSEAIERVEKQYEKLDNYFLSFLMYKTSYVIDEIKKLEPDFKYSQFIKGKNWNDLYGYLEDLKSPVEIDYTKIYEND